MYVLADGNECVETQKGRAGAYGIHGFASFAFTQSAVYHHKHKYLGQVDNSWHNPSEQTPERLFRRKESQHEFMKSSIRARRLASSAIHVLLFSKKQ